MGYSCEPPQTKKPQPRQKKTIIVQPLGVRTPLDGFFSRYPKFLLQPSESPVVEFNRLCKTYNWKENNRKKNAAREAFQIAMKKEFDNLYGSDEKDIKNWQKLCYVLRIDPVPDTLWTCRAEVLKKHVNLVDLVHGSKEEVRIFQTEEELSKYTKETKKFFPKEDAVDGGVLRALRRHILAPREGTSSSMSKGPGRYLELK
ncbi:hypothetical protein EDB92DRAFT_1794906 [Lactarius akahatsu]|uniref:Uncharacterized protein n=1 Tax=Lactarius akahatsu TaxID=416441 RepID=A0AAD4LQH5_9AGAM|nr:hypothetical protein EDB92DRAFT_1794906 [Lactarius akahatsu]